MKLVQFAYLPFPLEKQILYDPLIEPISGERK